MASSDDDQDFRLAMALSLQQTPSAASTNKAVVVDLTSDNEDEASDEDLKQAIALSLQDNAHRSEPIGPLSAATVYDRSSSTIMTPMAELTQQASICISSTQQDHPGSNSFVSNRKVMEEERLARLEKRKRKRSPAPDQPLKQTKAPAVIESKPANLHSCSNHLLQYPTGAVKRTFATRFSRSDDITIDELLQAPLVNIAVISSFQWDAEWLGRKLSHNKVKQIWVMNARGADTQARWRQELAECGIPNLIIHFPPTSPGVGNAHSKFMLLFSESKLRVVVSTANMEREYWGEVGNDWQAGVLENTVFVIDLPRRANDVVGINKDLTPFGTELVRFLEAQRLDPKVVDGVLKFDFSQTGHVGFVHSIGGRSNMDSHPTGLLSLAKTIQDLRLGKVKSIELDYATSSLGGIDDILLRRIYLAAQGLPFTTAPETTVDLHEKFRVYYPTEDTIKTSIGGANCAGVISLSKKHYSSPTFPTVCLRDYVSTRKGMLSHNKLLFARGRHADGRPFAWVYVGSANLSESAWGAQKVLKSGKLGKLSIRNWECGVVIPVPSEKLQALKLGQGEVAPMSIFEGTIEVPFECPGQRYEGRKPWVQDF